jgi:hypothetical protein
MPEAAQDLTELEEIVTALNIHADCHDDSKPWSEIVEKANDAYYENMDYRIECLKEGKKLESNDHSRMVYDEDQLVDGYDLSKEQLINLRRTFVYSRVYDFFFQGNVFDEKRKKILDRLMECDLNHPPLFQRLNEYFSALSESTLSKQEFVEGFLWGNISHPRVVLTTATSIGTIDVICRAQDPIEVITNLPKKYAQKMTGWMAAIESRTDTDPLQKLCQAIIGAIDRPIYELANEVNQYVVISGQMVGKRKIGEYILLKAGGISWNFEGDEEGGGVIELGDKLVEIKEKLYGTLRNCQSALRANKEGIRLPIVRRLSLLETESRILDGAIANYADPINRPYDVKRESYIFNLGYALARIYNNALALCHK